MPGSQSSLANPQSRLLRPCGLNALIHRVLRSSIAARSADPASIQIYQVHTPAWECCLYHQCPEPPQCGMQLPALEANCWQVELLTPDVSQPGRMWNDLCVERTHTRVMLEFGICPNEIGHGLW